MAKLTSIDVTCPRCGARPGRSCRSDRIASPASFGGGWGGPVPLQRSHSERAQAARDRNARKKVS